jgi:hypothetical protein
MAARRLGDGLKSFAVQSLAARDRHNSLPIPLLSAVRGRLQCQIPPAEKQERGQRTKSVLLKVWIAAKHGFSIESCGIGSVVTMAVHVANKYSKSEGAGLAALAIWPAL